MANGKAWLSAGIVSELIVLKGQGYFAMPAILKSRKLRKPKCLICRRLMLQKTLI